MVLRLAGANFRQWEVGSVSGGKRDLVAPCLGNEPTEELQQYMECSWRQDSMSFLDFLRKTNKHGEIAGWLKKKHKQQVESRPAGRGNNIFVTSVKQLCCVKVEYCFTLVYVRVCFFMFPLEP